MLFSFSSDVRCEANKNSSRIDRNANRRNQLKKSKSKSTDPVLSKMRRREANYLNRLQKKIDELEAHRSNIQKTLDEKKAVVDNFKKSLENKRLKINNGQTKKETKDLRRRYNASSRIYDSINKSYLNEYKIAQGQLKIFKDDIQKFSSKLDLMKSGQKKKIRTSDSVKLKKAAKGFEVFLYDAELHSLINNTRMEVLKGEVDRHSLNFYFQEKVKMLLNSNLMCVAQKNCTARVNGEKVNIPDETINKELFNFSNTGHEVDMKIESINKL